MKNNGYKPRVPDIMEAVFDIGYLLFDLIAAVLFFVFSKGNSLFVLYGILTLTLCGGDAFHLVPRVIRAFRGSSDKIKKAAGYGVADFLCHDDRFLHSADVYLEKYIPGNANSRPIGNHHLGIRIGAYYRMSAAPKPLVLG